MRIIGEKLSSKEMLLIKGGSITCQCGWQGEGVGPEIEMPTNSIEGAIQLIHQWCLSETNGAAHCYETPTVA